jgi:hypothetical protein
VRSYTPHNWRDVKKIFYACLGRFAGKAAILHIDRPRLLRNNYSLMRSSLIPEDSTLVNFHRRRIELKAKPRK